MGFYFLVKFFMALDKMLFENNVYSRADAMLHKPGTASMSEKEYLEIMTKNDKK